MIKKSIIVSCMAVMGLGVMNATASLIMNVNAGNETFHFDGSDTGSGEYFAYLNHYEVSFSSGSSGTWLSGGPGAVQVSTGFAGASEAYVYVYADNGIGLGFSSGENGANIVSLVADSNQSYSYAAWSVDAKNALEGAVGSTMNLQSGSAGYTGVAIQAIPEPATLGLLSLIGGGLIALRRIFVI